MALFSDSLAVTSLLTTNRVCSHLAYFELTQHPSLSAPQDLSAPLHLFTSRVSFRLGTHHSSVYLWPNTRFHQLPAALTASHPPFTTIIIFFFRLSFLSRLIPLSQPPTSISLPLPKTLLSLSHTHSVALFFHRPFSQHRAQQKYYPPIWLHWKHFVVVFDCWYVSVCDFVAVPGFDLHFWR